MRNQMDQFSSKVSSFIPYNHRLSPLLIRDALYSLIPEGTEHIYVAGIGSNRISGDSLGPFVGTLLDDLFPNHLTVFGNLKLPLDCISIESEISKLSLPGHSFVVAIDSVLGNDNTINSIVVQNGHIKPGKGLGSDLPPIGDCSVMGVVVKNDCDLETELLFSDLHLIYTMANNIAKGISLAVRQYFHYPSTHPILQIG
ncbi:spore protease YyaC [Bacillus sp. DNRA2]|uniref:spore protease YyaC n=1 Tax=Bacillus sp. DNRA2 TaxID=2723053 RepID=UPI002006E929|nr:spore protease YyaC [Bacillus sp. DNRA2]